MKELKLFLIIGLVWGSSFSQSITSAEYFFDSDPGVGNGTTVAVNANSGNLTQSFFVPTTGLSNGFHSFYFRTLNDEGNWSLYDRTSIYIASSLSGQTILSAEYFFGDDPGVGNGNALTVNSNSGNLTQSYSIPITGLSEGFHSFYIRTQVADGSWGLYDRQIIYIKDFVAVGSDIVSAEYFIDADPGVGNGTSFSISTSSQMIAFDTDGLANGDHLFYVRVLNQDGDWSFYDSAIFTIDPNLSVNESVLASTTIYPNPFVEEIAIDSSENFIINTIEVYDMGGKTVYSSIRDQKTINLSQLSTGIYILRLQTDTAEATFKIIKQ